MTYEETQPETRRGGEPALPRGKAPSCPSCCVRHLPLVRCLILAIISIILVIVNNNKVKVVLANVFVIIINDVNIFVYKINFITHIYYMRSTYTVHCICY